MCKLPLQSLRLRAPLVFPIILAMAAFVSGCSGPDARLVSDEQTCVSMGHNENSPAFNKCLSDLNSRRCDYGAKHGHVASRACTKL